MGRTTGFAAGGADIWLIKVSPAEKTPTPVFGVLFAIVGLLAMAHLVRRRR